MNGKKLAVEPAGTGECTLCLKAKETKIWNVEVAGMKLRLCTPHMEKIAEQQAETE